PWRARVYTSRWSGGQMAKERDLILAASAQFSAPVRLAAQMRPRVQARMAGGAGQDEYIATVRHAEQIAGLRLSCTGSV
ncbi:MAG: hypothetical protein ACKODB_11510, partial [Betaproteobacteria bacterium]